MSKVLTVLSVRNMKPRSHRREVPDGGARGLLLVIQANGSRSWAMRFRRPNGKSAKLTLGSCDATGAELEGEPVIGGHLTLAAARALASDIHRQRAMGKDVVAERRAERQRRTVAGADAAIREIQGRGPDISEVTLRPSSSSRYRAAADTRA